MEGIGGTTCPLTDESSYVVHHNPFVDFDDVADNPNDCIEHIRPCHGAGRRCGAR